MLRRLSGTMPVKGLAQVEHLDGVHYYYLLSISLSPHANIWDSALSASSS